MRGTMKIATNTALNTILDNYNRLLTVQNQMSLGRRVVNPKDDPLATNTAMRIDTITSRLAQFDRNIAVGTGFLGLSDASLDDVNNIVTKVKSLTIAGANETTTNEMRRTNAVEVNSMVQELVMLGNRKDGSRYIFAGTETTKPPFEVVGGRYVHYRGNDKDIKVQVDEGTNVPINVTSATVFGSMESVLTTRDLNPDGNMALNMSTRLEDLNNGNGVPKGTINIRYSGYPNLGIDIDLSNADTLEDVKDIIESTTRTESSKLDPTGLGIDEADRYIHVEINDDLNGLRLYEVDLGTSGPTPAGPTPPGPVTGLIQIRETGGNTVARDLGIQGNSVGGMIVGKDTDPILSEQTLLADLEWYTDSPITITNGGKPETVQIRELNDDNNIADNWNLHGLTEGVTTTKDDEIFTRIGQPVAGTWQVEVFRSPSMLPSERIAVGTSNAAGGTVQLSADNNSGVSGTVSINYLGAPGSSQDLDMQATFDPTFRSTISVPAFEETGDVNNQLSNWHIRGLEKGVSTDANSNLYVRVDGVGNVSLYNDPGFAAANLVATGALPSGTDGTVQLRGIPGTAFAHVQGTVDVDFSGGPVAEDSQINATFATVNDLINAINSSNTYTTARVADDGRGFEIVSHLGGAYLTVAEDITWAPITGDSANRLRQLNLTGVVNATNTDPDGNLYMEMEQSATVPGTYEIRVYKDSGHTELVASGSTNAAGLVSLQEENRSGINGSVMVDALGDDLDMIVPLRGFESTGDDNNQLNGLTLEGIRQGVNTDSEGNLYTQVIDTGPGGPYEVRLYRDPAMAAGDLVATGTVTTEPALVTLNEANNSGLYGQVNLDYVADDNMIVFTPNRRLPLGGQVREQNIFSTMNDVNDAMLANDTDALSQLVGNFKLDADRVLLGRAEIGSRIQRLEFLEERHADEIINFSQIRSDRVDLDYASAVVNYQSLQNVYEASLRVTGQIIPLSLVDFI